MCWRTPFFAIVAFVAVDTYVFGQVQDAAESAEIGSFLIRTYRGGPDQQQVLKCCLGLRKQLQQYWLPTGKLTAWSPPCEIVLHRTRAAYLRAVGGQGGQTKGSSLIQFDRQRIVKRRVDLLVNDRGETPALLHEIAHVFLADLFPGQRPPRWIDEGIATMVDSAEKQILHHRDCREALTSGTALRVGHLLTLQEFQSAEQVAPFYGQSLSLVRFLAEQDKPSQLIAFSKTAMAHGYDHALRQFYGFDGVADLEQRWQDYATAARKSSIQPVSMTTE